MRRKRGIFSVSRALISKSREAALAAIQVFNNPQVKFKSETFIVLMIIAWTYLLHAHFRKQRIEYRYYEQRGKRRDFTRTEDGNYKYWELRSCLKDKGCPIDNETKKNLEFLIGLRNEIEHHMSPNLDNYLSARYQACCLNYSRCVKDLFGDKYGIDQFVTYSLQLSQLSEEQVSVADDEGIPSNVRSYIARFDKRLTKDELDSPKFAYRVLFVPKLAGRAGQADRVIEFVRPDSVLAGDINNQYVVLKETERRKHRATDVVKRMREEGFVRFGMHEHTQLWKKLDAKNPGRGYGVRVDPEVPDSWRWYERWVDEVRQHCVENRDRYLS